MAGDAGPTVNRDRAASHETDPSADRSRLPLKTKVLVEGRTYVSYLQPIFDVIIISRGQDNESSPTPESETDMTPQQAQAELDRLFALGKPIPTTTYNRLMEIAYGQKNVTAADVEAE